MACPECGHISIDSTDTIDEVIEHITDMGDISLRVALDDVARQTMGMVHAEATEFARAFARAGGEPDYLWVGSSINHPGSHEFILWGPPEKISATELRPPTWKPWAELDSDVVDTIAVALLEAQYLIVQAKHVPDGSGKRVSVLEGAS